MDTQRKPFQPEWKITPGLTDYPEALATMEERVQAILEGKTSELVWFLEHPPLYTAGTSAKAADLLAPRFPVFQTGRGGQYTYHGPGQLIAYVMLDLRTREQDIRRYVFNLEEWLIQALRILDVDAVRRDGRVGLWVERSDGRDDKIAAIGVRIRRWITLHGISVNISPDMSHYAGIVPCGIKEHGITSLERLGKTTDRAKVTQALQDAWHYAF